MPIYEYYCRENHTVYQFYAKTLAQGRQVPACPDNPAWRLEKIVSAFAVTGRNCQEPAAPAAGGSADDPKMEAAMEAMEREFAHVDENDPRAMARMMRRLAEVSGEKIDGEMEEVVRKLEEGADPESLEDQLGGETPGDREDPDGMMPGGPAAAEAIKEARHRFRVRRKLPPRRDPKLYDYDS